MKSLQGTGLVVRVLLSAAVWAGARTPVGALAVDGRQGDQYGWAVDYETSAAARDRGRLVSVRNEHRDRRRGGRAGAGGGGELHGVLWIAGGRSRHSRALATRKPRPSPRRPAGWP